MSVEKLLLIQWPWNNHHCLYHNSQLHFRCLSHLSISFLISVVKNCLSQCLNHSCITFLTHSLFPNLVSCKISFTIKHPNGGTHQTQLRWICHTFQSKFWTASYVFGMEVGIIVPLEREQIVFLTYYGFRFIL